MSNMNPAVAFPSNKREAKREACRTVALLIDNYFGVGQPYDEGERNDVAEKDIKRFATALEELRGELERRSGYR